MPNTIQGGCLCGAIRYAIHEELAPIQVCHCSQCRKAQGGPFATNIPVHQAAFEILSGEALIQRYESTPGKYRCFCRTCGSPLYSQRTSVPDVLRLRAGTLDGEIAARPAFHAYVGTKANWWQLADALPKHPAAAA